MTVFTERFIWESRTVPGYLRFSTNWPNKWDRFELHILFCGEYQFCHFCNVDYKLAGVAPGFQCLYVGQVCSFYTRVCFCWSPTKAMLSAYSINLESLSVILKSLVKRGKWAGERTHPCWQPLLTVSTSDMFPPTHTLWGKQERNCLIQRIRPFLMLGFFNLLTLRS